MTLPLAQWVRSLAPTRRIRSAYLLVGTLSAAGAVLSFAREVLFARAFGVTAEADVFLLTTTAVNTVLLVLAWGSISVAASPVLFDASSRLAPYSRAERSSAVLVVSLLPLAVSTAGVLILAPALIHLLGPGLPSASVPLAAGVMMLLAPLILLGGMAAVGVRLLQAEEQFLLAGIVNLLLPLPAIGMLLLPYALGITVSLRMVAIAVTAGAALQVVVAAAAIARHLRWPRRAAVTATWPRVWQISLPLLVYSGLSYIDVLLERALASTLGTGTVAEFAYATRIFSLFATFALTPVATVFLPRFSRLHADSAGSAYLHTWLVRAAVLGGLATACFVGAGEPLVAVVYGHGRFAAPAVSATYQLLAIYALGTVATSVASLLVSAVSAARMTRVAAYAAAIDVATYLVLAVALSRRAGPAGLAAARVISFWLVLVILAVFVRRRLPLRVWRLSVVTAGCAAVGVGAAGVTLAVGPSLHGPGQPELEALLVLGLLSAGLYGLALGTVRVLAGRIRWLRASI